MLRKRFEHFTFNTGHRIFQYERDFILDEATRSGLQSLVQESVRPGGAKVIGNITFVAMVERDMYMGTLFSNTDAGKVPLLTTSGARTRKSGQQLWEILQGYAGEDRNVARMKRRRLHVPFVADIIYDCCLPDAQAFDFFFSGLSGSFCKYVGWAFLFPELIEGRHGMAAKDGRGRSAEMEPQA